MNGKTLPFDDTGDVAYHSGQYGCYFRGACKHGTRSAYSVYGFAGHHTYRLDLEVDGWDVATYKTMEVVVAWNLAAAPHIKAVQGTTGCALVGFNSHSITIAGDRSGPDCSVEFQTQAPVTIDSLTDSTVLCAPIKVVSCPPPPSLSTSYSASYSTPSLLLLAPLLFPSVL